MKKVLSLVVIAAMITLVACGPSAEEKAATEKAKQDSIAATEKAKQDSIAASEAAMAEAEAAKAQAAVDTAAAAPAAEEKK